MKKNEFNLEKYIELRHELHKIPEMAYREFKTKELLFSVFKTISGFSEYAKVVEIGDTGFYIDVWGTNSPDEKVNKQLISFRCDLDALPLEDKTGTLYKSIFENMAHACGHDGHMAILTCALEFFLSNLSKLKSNFGVRFLYQPAEEGGKGAVQMIKGGCLEGVNSMYGLHNLTLFPVGTIGCVVGPIMGRSDVFDVEIVGKGGHGSAPDLCCNPILPGSMMISAISNIPAQEMPNKERCVATVCKFQSGHTFNVIPDTANISGSVRTLKNEHAEKIISRIKDICEGISKVCCCNCNVKTSFLAFVVENDKKETEFIENIIQKYFVLSKENLPVMGSEDFAFYGEKVPSVFVMLGGGDETHKEYIHTSNYDFNDKSLGIGAEFFIRIIESKFDCKLMN